MQPPYAINIIWTANLVLITYASSEGSGELRIRAVSPEPSLLAHTSSESRGTFRQKARSLAPLNGWACAVKICNDGMLEDTNSLDGAHIVLLPSHHQIQISRVFLPLDFHFKDCPDVFPVATTHLDVNYMTIRYFTL